MGREVMEDSEAQEAVLLLLLLAMAEVASGREEEGGENARCGKAAAKVEERVDVALSRVWKEKHVRLLLLPPPALTRGHS
jgi:hypothetical protein